MVATKDNRNEQEEPDFSDDEDYIDGISNDGLCVFLFV
jgi:hypothetical protein